MVKMRKYKNKLIDNSESQKNDQIKYHKMYTMNNNIFSTFFKKLHA